MLSLTLPERPPHSDTFQSFMFQWARRLAILAAVAADRHEFDAWAEGPLPELAGSSPPIDQAALEWALQRMHPLPRWALTLTLYENIAASEAARILRISEPRLRKALFAAVVEMTALLQRKAGLK